MFISTLIADAGDRLTKSERILAEAVLEDPTLLAFGTVSDLAERVGTSRPTVVRFATKLGFEGFSDLQAEVRGHLTPLLGRPAERIRQAGDALAPRRTTLEGAIGAAFSALEEGRLEAMAEPLVSANHVWILSGETSRAGALALHSGLKMIRPHVQFIEEHSVGRDLSGAAEGDVAVVFDFARYRRHSVTAARALAKEGVHIVAVTDGPLSPLAALTETWCGLEVPAMGPFDSSVPAVIVAEMLVAEVSTRLQEQAKQRIDRTEEMWRATETFLEEE